MEKGEIYKNNMLAAIIIRAVLVCSIGASFLLFIQNGGAKIVGTSGSYQNNDNVNDQGDTSQSIDNADTTAKTRIEGNIIIIPIIMESRQFFMELNKDDSINLTKTSEEFCRGVAAFFNIEGRDAYTYTDRCVVPVATHIYNELASISISIESVIKPEYFSDEMKSYLATLNQNNDNVNDQGEL